MSKSRVLLIAVSSVGALAVLAAGVFLYSVLSAKTAAREGDDESFGLDYENDKADRLSRKRPYPCAESVTRLKDAASRLEAWVEEAQTLASGGDRPLRETTAPLFKEFIVADSRRLAALPAGADKKTLSEAFDFGPFKPYISGSEMPPPEKLPQIQRQWTDVSEILEMLSSAGVESALSVAVKTEAEKKPPENEPKPKRPGMRKKPAAAAPKADDDAPKAWTYELVFKATPASLTRALNEFATVPRFMVASDLSFSHEKDTLLENLGGEKKKEEARPVSRRRFRAAEKEETQKEKDALFTVLTDPAAGPLFDVRLSVTVYDFRSMEKKADEGEAK